MKGIYKWLSMLGCMLMLVTGCNREDPDSRTVRIGCFPNVTHVQGLVARNMTRHGEGWFERYLPGYRFEWYTYSAGPTAMEALFGRTVDVTYVGPSPAINAYSVASGREIRLLAGAVNGGAALVVPGDSPITKPADFKGRSIGTPQLGNTQDVSCRAWLAQNGLTATLEGSGDCRVAPTANSMMLQLMRQGDLDGCWTVEPWVTRLETMGGAKVFVSEPNVVTTVLVAREKWLGAHPEAAASLIKAHADLTQWILDHPEEAKKRVQEEISFLTQTEFPMDVIESAWARLTVTTAIDVPGLEQFVRDAQAADLISRVPPIEGMIYHPMAAPMHTPEGPAPEVPAPEVPAPGSPGGESEPRPVVPPSVSPGQIPAPPADGTQQPALTPAAAFHASAALSKPGSLCAVFSKITP